jgi:hypothetical protein
MPIMAAHERSDARGAARLLALMALDCIDNPEAAVEQEVALNNVYRLLESYRSDVFFGLDTPRQPFRRISDKLALTPPRERHVGDVRDAIEQARLAVFAEQSKDDAIASIENVLRSLAYPTRKDLKRPSPADRKNAAKFFKTFLKQL